jgi:uncharacterized membrane protein YkvA (DUF1232 family)
VLPAGQAISKPIFSEGAVVHLLEVIVIAGTLVIVTFLILLSLPHCKLRDMLMPFVAWGFIALCAAYTISPVDALPEIVLGPFGLFDDFVAAAAGIGTAMATIRASKQKKSHMNDPYFN